jgi:glucosamine--fructose-6-phosphate aminotransferase (isomerizing)
MEQEGGLMCGIFAFAGRRAAAPVLVRGLRRLEYRGYDSAGLATLADGNLHMRKCAGRIVRLEELLDRRPAPGCVGISHTRWATHGPATAVNAHPHLSADGTIAVVHNGVIENAVELRDALEGQGVAFRSGTDTEVIAQLIGRHWQGDLVEAVRRVVPLLRGTYGMAVLCTRSPGELVGLRLGNPLVLGIGRQEHFLASDGGALAGLAERAVHLHDHQMCVVSADGWQLLDADRARVAATVEDLTADAADAECAPFDHFMLKEIYEQPEAVASTLRGRLDEANATAHFNNLGGDPEQWRRLDRIILTGCGTSYHAALIGEYLIEEFARIPVEVEYASEFRYRNPPIGRTDLVVGITQSGETADTLAALREAKRRGYPTLAICNVVDSSLAREADGGIYLRAGPEVGVASTKAFTCQLMALTLFALYLGRQRGLTRAQGTRIIRELQAVPAALRRALACHDEVRRVAERTADVENMLYLGRQYLYPVALEGALKLKEVSYIHAHGYPTAELKHGPIALVDEVTPSVFLMTRGAVYDKLRSNLEEIKARNGPVIVVATENDAAVARRADEVLFVPDVPSYLQPIVVTVPLQLLAYHVALLRGCDVDRPRNLAKSVTVE